MIIPVKLGYGEFLDRIMAPDLNDLTRATWLNPPPEWRHDDRGLSVTTGHETDFWRETYYGFQRDSGHFLGTPVEGDFTAIVTFDGAYETLYDQAGLMLRLDEQRWLKAGIEFSDGVTNFSSVVTRGRSDWAVISVPRVTGPQSVRLTRIGEAVLLHFKDAGGSWHLMRVADFPADGEATLGIMACSPQRSGFRVLFNDFTVGPTIASPLH